jgi:hypothetical protein
MVELGAFEINRPSLSAEEDNLRPDQLSCHHRFDPPRRQPSQQRRIKEFSGGIGPADGIHQAVLRPCGPFPPEEVPAKNENQRKAKNPRRTQTVPPSKNKITTADTDRRQAPPFIDTENPGGITTNPAH